jgi:hypothetical protein
MSETQVFPMMDYNPEVALGATLAEYKFYGGEMTVYYDDDEHSYSRFDKTGYVLIPGVTTVVHIIDKSQALTQWAANMTAEAVMMLYEQHFAAGRTWADVDEATLRAWLNEARFNYKAYTKEAADVGSMAHNWIEKLIKNLIRRSHDWNTVELPELPSDERARSCCDHAVTWIKRHNVRFLSTERKIYSRKYDFAGTMDGLGLVDSCNDVGCRGCKSRVFKDRLAVIDWKSSNRLYDEYRYQTAAYAIADEEEFPEHDIQDRWILRLGKTEGDFEPWLLTEEDFETDAATFIACLNLYNAIEKGKNERSERKAAVKAAAKAEMAAAKQAEKERKAAEKIADRERKAKVKLAEKLLKKLDKHPNLILSATDIDLLTWYHSQSKEEPKVTEDTPYDERVEPVVIPDVHPESAGAAS